MGPIAVGSAIQGLCGRAPRQQTTLRCTDVIRAAFILSLSALLFACAAGEESNTGNLGVSVTNITIDGASTSAQDETGTPGTTAADTTEPADPTTTGATTTIEFVTTEPATTEPATTATTEPATTEPATTGPGCACDLAPDACHTAPGECVDGECLYPPAATDSACDDGDACTEGDVCDGAGSCEGAPKTCEAEHATGNCQDDGCKFSCVAPYEDCDGDWGNGCEVPVGLANQCDVNGLNPDGGCWTAYCGSSDSAKATNFGSFYCSDCSTCNTPAANMWQWCNHGTGNWYPAESGNCGANEDLVCAP